MYSNLISHGGWTDICHNHCQAVQGPDGRRQVRTQNILKLNCQKLQMCKELDVKYDTGWYTTF